MRKWHTPINKVEQTRISLFQRPVWVVVLALTTAIAWGWAFPLIKVGFNAFGITADMTGSKILFAGIRFAMAGFIVLSVARSSGRSFKANKAAIKHVNRQHFVLSDKKERARKSTDSQALDLWSGLLDSNQRPRAPQTCALPTALNPDPFLLGI